MTVPVAAAIVQDQAAWGGCSSGFGQSIVGRLTGSSIENEDNLAFSLAHGIRPSIETMPFEPAMDAYERMLSGKARFRVVLDVTA
ncbi:hypothetical protein ABT404_08905 [Streptomyces hyaluromycini]|uniref:Alcohol dehydrogenase n=1 Tax=Streptomyces hyaluromycini TaxID=1377993 RepID=A0ABV1WRW3_9ACTN